MLDGLLLPMRVLVDQRRNAGINHLPPLSAVRVQLVEYRRSRDFWELRNRLFLSSLQLFAWADGFPT